MSVIHSTAFPAHLPQQEHSIVHRLLREATHIEEDVKLRPFRTNDIGFLKDLNKEWFPIQYGDAFYDRLRQGVAKCWVAECIITSKHNKQKPIIVGAIMYEYTGIDGDVLAKESWL